MVNSDPIMIPTTNTTTNTLITTASFRSASFYSSMERRWSFISFPLLASSFRNRIAWNGAGRFRNGGRRFPDRHRLAWPQVRIAKLFRFLLRGVSGSRLIFLLLSFSLFNSIISGRYNPIRLFKKGWVEAAQFV